jgi:AcrR family transcriptional regulator
MSRQPRITGNAIVDAALRVADEVGLDGLTVRGVAVVAGMAPMSLYTYFQTKDELLDHMARELSRRLYSAGDHASWQASLRASCNCMRDLLLAHPNWLPLVARPTPAVDVAARERLLRQMTAAGIEPNQAFLHVVHAGLLALSLTTLELEHRGREGGSTFDKRFENLLSQCDDGSFVAQNRVTSAALRSLPSLSFASSFSAILDAFIAGIEETAAGAKEPASSRARR